MSLLELLKVNGQLEEAQQNAEQEELLTQGLAFLDKAGALRHIEARIILLRRTLQNEKELIDIGRMQGEIMAYEKIIGAITNSKKKLDNLVKNRIDE